jgi:hypothetical protein
VRAGLRHSPSLREQVAAEEELEQCNPTVFQGNIAAILLDGLRVHVIAQHHDHVYKEVCTGMYRYVEVHRSIIP